MKILGIDPGIGILGFGVIESKNGNDNFIDAGVIKTQIRQADSKRLLTIFEELETLINDHKPDVMAIEKLFFIRNITTAMSVSQARGVVLLLGQQHDLEIFEYTPLQIKQAVTGYGKADKRQIQEMVKAILKLKTLPKPDDAADALATAICCSTSMR